MTPNEYLDLKSAALKRCFSRMNPTQLEAVTTVTGPVLVLAGAGSGKTTVIINRIANMVLFGDTANEDTPIPGADTLARLRDYIEGGSMSLGELRDIIAAYPVKPWQILAITFTNKAAGELKSRLADTLGEEAREVQASTFHSACVRILRACIEREGYSSDFTIYDSDDSLRVMKSCMKDMNISEKKFNPKSILASISHAKDQMLDPDAYAAEVGTDFWKRETSRLYKEYQSRLKAADAVDFDDLIFLTVRIFERNADILEKYQNRWRYILVDEYQDTNYAQYRLVSLLAEKYGNLCVVGDDDQSIYRFRGATIENILQFEEQFPGCKVIRLEENYRSTQHILDAANAVIANNQARKEKRLWTAAGEGEKPQLLKVPAERDEGQFICDTIEQGVKDGKPYADFAVLYRMNALSNSIERALLRNKIPYRIYGGLRFQDRKEIRDVTAYLCLLQNPHDLVRFERIVNVPKRGIGDATAASVMQIARDLGLSVIEVCRDSETFPAIAKRKSALTAFASMMQELTDAADTMPLEELFDLLLDRTGYLDALKAEGEQGETRIENVKEFRSNIVEYVTESTEPSLSGFLEETALFTDADRASDGDAVSLMTMHSAKGLEFDTVFAVGMEDGIFPSMRSMDSQEDMEEERRLAYVTITRAKRHLYLMQCRERLLFGSYKQNPLSRFVKEIPEKLLERDDRSPSLYDVPAEIGTAKGISGMRAQMAAIQRQRKAAPVSSAGNGLTFKAGDRITDAVFGEGTVLRADPMAGDYLLEVAFDTVGTKKLMAKYRKITKN